MASNPAAMILVLFISFTVLRFAHCVETRDNDEKVISNMKRVKDKIFANYDKDMRPELHHNHTTYVDLDLAPGYVIELDEEKSLFTLDSWFVFLWQDKRLQWNPSDYDGIDSLSVPDNYTWQPDIRVYNGHSSSVDPMHDTHLMVHSDGLVVWAPPATVTSFCDVTTNVGSYPYDTHECNITVGCWTHSGREVNVNITSEEMYWDLFYNSNPRWEVVIEKSKLSQVVKKNNCCEETYIVDAKFFLKRRPPAEMRVVGTPSILVMILTLGMFWIPSDSGKKMILGGSLLIILTTLTIYCAAMTASPGAPLLSVSFVQSTMIAVASAVVLEVLIINLGRMSGPRKPPDFLVGLLSGSLGDYMCICPPWRQVSPGNKIRLHEDATGPGDMEPTPEQQWLAVATCFDRVLFIIYIVVFAAIHQL